MRSVFISYSSNDEAEVKKIVRLLEDNKISYFKAPECIPAGSNYAKEIPGAIKNCEVFLLVISRYSQNSVWVEKEIDCAINNRKIIIPVQISSYPLNELFNFYLNNVQVIRYFENPVAGLIQINIRIDMILGRKTDPNIENKANEVVKEPVELVPEKTGVEKEIEELKKKKEKIVNKNRVVKFYDDSEGLVNAFTRSEKTNKEEKILSHREIAQRNNAVSVNKIPECCEQCKGNLIEIHTGTYKCVQCGYINYDYNQKIRNCLAENGPLNSAEISKITKVDRRVVEYFLLDEKLEIPRWSEISLSCQACGAPIYSGVLCDKCKMITKQDSSKKTISTHVGYRYIKKR